MLEDSLFESQGRRRTRKPVTVFISVIIHIGIVVVLALIPLVQTQAITIPVVDMSLWAPKPEPPQVIEVTAVTPRVRTQIEIDPNDVIAPPSIPPEIAYVIKEPVAPSASLPLSTEGNGVGSILRDLISRQAEVEAPPLPPPPPPPVSPQEKVEPIRISVGVQQANLIHQVLPVYPPLARQARVQGVVFLEALISKEGTIESLRVINGHPLLIQAAFDAVHQWRYRPTLLNGEPVEVVTTVTVNFTLQ